MYPHAPLPLQIVLPVPPTHSLTHSLTLRAGMDGVAVQGVGASRGAARFVDVLVHVVVLKRAVVKHLESAIFVYRYILFFVFVSEVVGLVVVVVIPLHLIRVG